MPARTPAHPQSRPLSWARPSSLFTAALLLVGLALTPHVARAQYSVSPQSGSTTAPSNASGRTVTFATTKTSTGFHPATTSCDISGQVTSCSISSGGAGSSVVVTYATGSAGTGQVWLHIESTNGTTSGWYDVTVGDLPPIVDATPHNGDHLDVSRCVMDCWDNVRTYSTPSYVSVDVARSQTLIYRSGYALPTATVQLDVSQQPGVAPTRIRLQVLKEDGITMMPFVGGATQLDFQWSGGPQRIGGVLDVSGLSTVHIA